MIITETEIQQLQNETEKDEIVPDRVDTVSDMSCGGSSRTETVREQCYDWDDNLEDTPEDHTGNFIHQRLIEIIHEGLEGDINVKAMEDVNKSR